LIRRKGESLAYATGLRSRATPSETPRLVQFR
jgi:hypothetical protein